MRRLRTFFPAVRPWHWPIRFRAKTLRRSIARATLSATIITLITVVLCLLVEGVASLIFVARGSAEINVPDAPWLLDHWHTEYDPELGWINKASFRNDEMYGPGLYLQTNSQRFRSTRDFEQQPPAGKVRAVCTGDSFTLGFGVSNDNTWCELLSRRDPRFETVNMGQGGYGVDQAYLWYRRDGLALEHDVLIFAFIAEDFTRMMQKTFQGYPKPVLSVQGGVPVVAEAPASRLTLILPSLRQRSKRLGKLRVMQLWQSVFEPKPGTDQRVMTDQQARELTLSMIEDLKARLLARDKALLVVLLPVVDDYSTKRTDGLRDFLKTELGRRQIRFLDLVSALRNEPGDRVSQLFRDHYNELGNSWVAEHLYPALIELGPVRKRLDHIGPSREAAAPLLAPQIEVLKEKD